MGRSGGSSTKRDTVSAVGFSLALLGLWELLMQVTTIPRYILPSPIDMFRELFRSFPILLQNMWVTLYETVAGFLLGVVLGVVLGIGIVYVRLLRTGFYPLLVGFQSVPKVAIAPLLVVWFGYGLLSKIAMSFLIAFFPLVVATVSGLSDVHLGLLELFRAMSASERQIFWKVRVPHALPYLLDGCKISLPLAVIGAIIGEFVGANAGLGNLILLSGSTLNTPLTFATLLVVTVMSIALFGLLVILEKFVWWRAL
ncbi:MAG: ABC transporter permease [Deltaproteobacteria bacterium]|nr:ABC transporter permease [Deltaproteobacteria bacterium]